jgi:hypothetical protein
MKVKSERQCGNFNIKNTGLHEFFLDLNFNSPDNVIFKIYFRLSIFQLNTFRLFLFPIGGPYSGRDEGAGSDP